MLGIIVFGVATLIFGGLLLTAGLPVGYALIGGLVVIVIVRP